MDIVLAVLGILVLPIWLATGALAALILVPFVVRAAGCFGTEKRARLRVGWAAGAVVVDYRMPRAILEVTLVGVRIYRREGPRHMRPKPEEKEQRKPQSKPGVPKKSARLGRVPACWPGIVRVLRRVWRSLAIRARGRCVVGLADPADTAMVAGLLNAVRGMLVLPVHVAPDFDAERLVFEGQVRVRAWLAEWVAIGVGVLLSTDMRNLIRDF